MGGSRYILMMPRHALARMNDGGSKVAFGGDLSLRPLTKPHGLPQPLLCALETGSFHGLRFVGTRRAQMMSSHAFFAMEAL